MSMTQSDGTATVVLTAHGFSDGDVPRMANGVLDHLAHLLRAAEFPAAAP